MIHGVVSVLQRNFFVNKAVALGEGGKLFWRSGHGRKPWIELFEILLQDFRRIALWINTDQNHLQLVSIRPKLCHQLGHAQQGRRANVGAVGEPKEHGHGLAQIVFLCDGLAQMAGHGEGAADDDFAVLLSGIFGLAHGEQGSASDGHRNQSPQDITH